MLSPKYQCCSANTNANAKFQDKAIVYYYTPTYLKIFVADFFYDKTFFTLFIF